VIARRAAGWAHQNQIAVAIVRDVVADEALAYAVSVSVSSNSGW